ACLRFFLPGLHCQTSDWRASTATATPSIITVHGPGGTPDVNILDGLSGALLDRIFAYDPHFTGGTLLANTPRRHHGISNRSDAHPVERSLGERSDRAADALGHELALGLCPGRGSGVPLSPTVRPECPASFLFLLLTPFERLGHRLADLVVAVQRALLGRSVG